MEPERFLQACHEITERGRTQHGIGTLGEKTIHAVLKRYFDPNEENHEIKVGSHVADIVGEDGITEIQTRSLNRLEKKLSLWLKLCSVTVVYPVVRQKWLFWVDEGTGEVTKKRKSSKTGTYSDALRELYRIKKHLCHPSLTIRLMLLDVEEYRLLNGWSADKKKGSTRMERIPVALAGECILRRPADYLNLLPESLPEPFTSKDLKQCARLSQGTAQMGLNVLHSVHAVERTGKQGNAYLYRKINAPAID